MINGVADGHKPAQYVCGVYTEISSHMKLGLLVLTLVMLAGRPCTGNSCQQRVLKIVVFWAVSDRARGSEILVAATEAYIYI